MLRDPRCHVVTDSNARAVRVLKLAMPVLIVYVVVKVVVIISWVLLSASLRTPNNHCRLCHCRLRLNRCLFLGGVNNFSAFGRLNILFIKNSVVT